MVAGTRRELLHHCLSKPRGEPCLLGLPGLNNPMLNQVALRLEEEWHGDSTLGDGAGRVKAEPGGQRGR